MARRVQPFYGNTAELEPLPIARRLSDGLTILPSDDREALHPKFGKLLQRLGYTPGSRGRKGSYKLLVTSSMVPVTIWEVGLVIGLR